MAQDYLKDIRFSVPARSHESGDRGKETEIYFADFNDVVIAEDGNMKVDFSKGSLLYIDADGTPRYLRFPVTSR